MVMDIIWFKTSASIHSSRRAPPAEDLPGPVRVGGDPEADGDPNLPAQSPIARRSGGWCLADQTLMHF